MPVVEQPGVDLRGGEVSDAHDVNLRGCPSRRDGLRALDFLEQLLHAVQERVVLRASKHFRDEPTALAQKLRGESVGVFESNEF
eukprot:31558-Pelagococcus_subviridis.AAC.14